MKPLLTLIATSHSEPEHLCPFVDSMLAQKDTNWKAIVFNNGRDSDIKQWIEDIGDNRFTYRESIIDSGNWGTANRHTAIQEMVDTPYVINTSIQDYYLPNAVEEINNALRADPDMVHWQAINHLFRYSVLNGEVAWGHIDWGQFCVKTEHIKATGIVKADNFSGDWHTLQAMIQRGFIRVSYKLDKILTIHN